MVAVSTAYLSFWILYELALDITDHNSSAAALVAAASIWVAGYLLLRMKHPRDAR